MTRRPYIYPWDDWDVTFGLIGWWLIAMFAVCVVAPVGMALTPIAWAWERLR